MPCPTGSGEPLAAPPQADADTDPAARARRSAPPGAAARPATARLFLALWPDAAVRAALGAQQSLWHWPEGAAPEAAQRLHLTLHFIGAVALDRLPALRAGLAVAMPPVALEWGRAELWRHGLAVLEPLAVPPALRSLHADLARALQALTLPVESRAFRPHVTLARRAHGAVPPPPAPPWRWDARGYVLVRSHGGAQGGYEVLERWP